MLRKGKMKINVMSEKVMKNIADGSGTTVANVSKPDKINIIYENNEIVPSEDIFDVKDCGLVKVLQRNGRSLIAKTL